MRGVIGKTRNNVLKEQSARNKNEQNEQKPKVELPLPSWQKAYGKNVKKEHFFKPKVELEIGIPDSSTHDLQTAVAAEPRTARNVHKWNNRTRDHFVDLVNNIRPNFEVSLSEDDVDFGSAGSAHGNDVESNVSDDDAKSQGADSAADIDKWYDLCRRLKEKKNMWCK